MNQEEWDVLNSSDISVILNDERYQVTKNKLAAHFNVQFNTFEQKVSLLLVIRFYPSPNFTKLMRLVEQRIKTTVYNKLYNPCYKEIV